MEYSAIKTCKCCRAFFLLCVWPGSAISQFWCKHFTNLIYPHYFTKPAFVSCLTFNRHFIFKSTIHPSVCHKLFRAISQKLFKFFNMKLHRCLYINEEKGDINSTNLLVVKELQVWNWWNQCCNVSSAKKPHQCIWPSVNCIVKLEILCLKSQHGDPDLFEWGVTLKISQ